MPGYPKAALLTVSSQTPLRHRLTPLESKQARGEVVTPQASPVTVVSGGFISKAFALLA